VTSADGSRWIENLQIRPQSENFDFEGGLISETANEALGIEARVDPWKVGTVIQMNYQGSPFTYNTYTQSEYASDLQYIFDSYRPIDNLLNALNSTLVQDLFNSGVTKFIDKDGRAIIYSENLDTEIDVNTASGTDLGIGPTSDYQFVTYNAPLLSDAATSKGIHWVGDSGVDNVKAGSKDDFLEGHGGNDIFDGREGADTLDGGAGDDVLVGGDGLDTLKGGAGADLLIAGTLVDKAAGTGTSSVQETVDGGAGTDYIVLTDADVDHVTVENGDTNDRLLLMPHLGGKTVGEGGALPFLALVGGVAEVTAVKFHTYSGFYLGTRLSTDVDPDAPPDFPGPKSKDFVLEDISGGRVEYKWYEEDAVLAISVHYTDSAGSEKRFDITLNNFSEGDYGISLTQYIVSTEYYYDDNPDRGFTVDDTAGYEAKVAKLIADANKYTLTSDLEFQQQARMFRAFSAQTSGSEGLDVDNIVMRLDGGANSDTLEGIDLREKLFGHDGDDRITAAGGNDVLDGGSGHDLLYGEEGDDEVYGGSGNDRLIGGAGADFVDGGDGVDTADNRMSEASVEIDLLNGFGLGGDAEGDFLSSIENVAGSQFGDVLIGDDGLNRLQGFDGNDQLSGGGGNDRLLGGSGADVITGGAGADTADYSTSLVGVTVNLKLNLGQGGDAEGDTFVAVENLSGSDFSDTLTGDDLNNRLSGVDGNDTLSGLGGIDYLVGGAGNDVMTGGAGADVFVFNLGSGRDTITDFWAGTGRTDRIQFADGQFGSFAAVLSQAVDTSSGVVITVSADDSLSLSGLQISQLRADDFLFA
jgi:Ca2+-binding RTX toxin-like protein